MYSIEEDIQNHRMVITSKYMKKMTKKSLEIIQMGDCYWISFKWWEKKMTEQYIAGYVMIF